MKRRKVLTSASVLAGAALTGCGGGGEDGALGGDPSSQIAATAVPAALVPNNGQYQVEIVFHTARALKVELICGNSSRITVGEKAATSGTSHKVGFSLLRCNNNNDFSPNTYLVLVITDGGVVTSIGGGRGNIWNGTKYIFDYNAYTGLPEKEYEWNCYSKSDSTLLCSARFFTVPSDETVLFPYGDYCRPIVNSPTHANGGGLTKLLPKLHTTSFQVPNHECAVLHDETNNCDTICLPNIRREGHDELVPSYLSASSSLQPLLKRRLLRHIDRYGRAVRAKYVMDTTDDSDVHHLLGNELVRVLGGKSLIDHLDHVRDNVRTSIQNNMQQMGTSFHTFCSNHLPALSSQAMIDQTRKLLDDEVDNGEGGSNMAGGCGVSTVVQIGFSMAEKTLWPGIVVGPGMRLTFGLVRASRKWYDATIAGVSTYNLAQIGTKGLKYGLTFIMKGFNGTELNIKGVSADIEVTLNMSVINGHHRLDLIQFDPVFDLDTRTWLGEMAAKGMERLLAPLVNGTQATQVLQGMDFAVPSSLTGLSPQMGEFAGKLLSSTAGFVSTGFKDYLNPFLKSMRDKFQSISGAEPRTWAVAEFSPLRFVVVNSDVENPDIAFRGGFRYGGVGWQPGVKFIAGVGAMYESKVETVTYTGFGRVVAVADLYGAYGPDGFIRSMGFPWEM
jgi:hypothetical protein